MAYWDRAKVKRMRVKQTIISFVFLGILVTSIDVDLSCAKDSEIPSSESFVFVGFYAGGAGPMPVSPENRFLAVASDGHGQAYKIVNSPVGDQLVSLEEKRVEAKKLFDYFTTNFSRLPASPVHLPNIGSRADEYVAPNVEIVIKISQDKAYHWEGQKKEVPKELNELIGLVEKNLQDGQLILLEKPYALLVANWLNSSAATQYRREGMMHEVGSGTNPVNAVVLESLQHTFQVIPVNQETNPFAPYCRSFSPGLQTLEASYSGKDFQIRSIAVTTNSKIGVKNESK